MQSVTEIRFSCSMSVLLGGLYNLMSQMAPYSLCSTLLLTMGPGQTEGTRTYFGDSDTVS